MLQASTLKIPIRHLRVFSATILDTILVYAVQLIHRVPSNLCSLAKLPPPSSPHHAFFGRFSSPFRKTNRDVRDSQTRPSLIDRARKLFPGTPVDRNGAVDVHPTRGDQVRSVVFHCTLKSHA